VGVHLLVVALHVVAAGEAQGAGGVGAREGSLPCVFAAMAGEELGAGESLVADLAFIFPFVVSHCHLLGSLCCAFASGGGLLLAYWGLCFFSCFLVSFFLSFWGLLGGMDGE